MKKKNIVLYLLISLCLIFAACRNEHPSDSDNSNIVTFDTTHISVLPGGDFQLQYTVPIGANVVFSSSDTSILTVDQNGMIHGVGSGTATVTASTGEYEKAYLEVTVEKDVMPALGNAVLNVDTVELLVGMDYNLTLTVQKEGQAVSDYSTVWTSSNEAVVTVDNGALKALTEGNAVISVAVTIGDETIEKQCAVAVYKHYDIQLNQSLIKAPIGFEFSLQASVYDSDGSVVTPAVGELELITSNPKAIAIQGNSFKVISSGTASVGFRYKGNISSIPVDIFSVTADFFQKSTSDFYGEVDGKTFSGVIIKSSNYQPHFYFAPEGITKIQTYAKENGFSSLRIHTYAILKNNSFRINGRYLPTKMWVETDVPISEINNGFDFWSESEGATEVYMWFEFK